VACHAPFTSMYLDQHGLVRACCQNSFHLLGDVREDRLLDIWRGERTRELRRAMERDDLSSGCDFCAWQISAGQRPFSHWFEDFPVPASDPEWPTQLELSITNTCNLQCVMCNGEWSSSIRSQREGRPPLEQVYGDDFFADLAEFVPHLERVKIYGGEPFLSSETLRVMDLLVDDGGRVRCHLTTNGTQWTPRVERILDMLPVDVAVSIDGATAATYESIRVGSSWDKVMRNLDRFQERAARNDTGVTLTFCLMTLNWHEFADFCRMADARGIGSAVNTVTDPAQVSLYRLPTAELRTVVEHLEHTERTEGRSFGLSRRTWLDELGRLRSHLDKQLAGVDPGLGARRSDPNSPDPFASSPGAVSVRIDVPPDPRVADEVPSILLSRTQEVLGIGFADQILGIPEAEFTGRHVEDLAAIVAAHHGPVVGVEMRDLDQSGQSFEATFENGARIAAVVVPAPAADGAVASRVYVEWLTPPPSTS